MSLQSTNDFQNEIKNKTFLVKMSFTGMKISPRPEVSGYFSIRNFFFPGTASVRTYPVNPAYESATFWIRSPEWTFLHTLWIRNRADANSGYFFIRWHNKIELSSLLWILYSRWQPRSQVLSLTRLYDACPRPVANIPIGVLGTGEKSG